MSQRKNLKHDNKKCFDTAKGFVFNKLMRERYCRSTKSKWRPDTESDSRGQRRDVVTISISSALSKGRASLRLASSSSRNGLEGETSSSWGNGGSGMPRGSIGKHLRFYSVVAVWCFFTKKHVRADVNISQLLWFQKPHFHHRNFTQ